MPNYVSKDGLWHPAKEHAVLPHLSGTKDEVYDGPDRAAMYELAQAHGVDKDGLPKITTFGMDFRNDPDLINRARQLGYKTVEDYAAIMGYDKAKVDADFKEKAAVIVKHQDPSRSPAKEVLGGGKDFSGMGQDKYGGFGTPVEIK